MEKQAGQQSASFHWAMVPHPIPGITGNSPKGNAQCGKNLKISKSGPPASPELVGLGRAGNPWCSQTIVLTATAWLMGIHHQIAFPPSALPSPSRFSAQAEDQPLTKHRLMMAARVTAPSAHWRMGIKPEGTQNWRQLSKMSALTQVLICCYVKLG